MNFKFLKTILTSLIVTVTCFAHVANAGLINEYTFDGNANDSSGNGYHGLLGGDASFGAGIFGQSLQLDGSGDFVSVDMPTQTFSSFTIEAWFNSNNSTPSDSSHLVSFNDANNFLVLWNLTSTSIDGWSSGLSSINLSGRLLNPLVANTWHHSAFSYDGSQTKMFVDGILVSSNTVTGTLAPIGGANKLAIGSRYDLSSQYFSGKLDNVRIYDEALEQSLLGFYTDGTVMDVPEPSTLAIFALGMIGLASRRFNKES